MKLDGIARGVGGGRYRKRDRAKVFVGATEFAEFWYMAYNVVARPRQCGGVWHGRRVWFYKSIGAYRHKASLAAALCALVPRSLPTLLSRSLSAAPPYLSCVRVGVAMRPVASINAKSAFRVRRTARSPYMRALLTLPVYRCVRVRGAIRVCVKGKWRGGERSCGRGVSRFCKIMRESMEKKNRLLCCPCWMVSLRGI